MLIGDELVGRPFAQRDAEQDDGTVSAFCESEWLQKMRPHLHLLSNDPDQIQRGS